METVIIGERGQITIPKELRKKYKFNPKTPVIIEDRDGEIVIKPAVVVSMDKIKSLLKEYDNEFIQEMVKSLSLSSDEEKKILKKWTKK
ncbi:MAG TPA: AbrB/MazE/SpoVT family DNA-binding domain-containing protein [Candidatus Ratteibacteria bacterium]|nr:AbrB/MazE/SpoVT family DNA-binding domain-containing protein [bacterium]HRR95782.1 AbrB/MazE/SpoVT family DNA-binding domain-containing protein [Candidatus Ratteibacteria bacterium]